MRVLSVFTFLVIIVTGCNTESLNPDIFDQNESINKEFQLAEKELQFIVDNITFEPLSNPNKNSRAKKDKRQVKGINKLQGKKNENIAYIVEFIDGGFVLIAIDKRINPILGFDRTGEFKYTNFDSYPDGLKDWILKTDDFLDKAKRDEFVRIDERAWSLETIQNVLDFEIEENQFSKNTRSEPVEGCYNHTDQYGYLLSTNWGQGSGYNAYLNSITCGSNSNYVPLTGCVATAMAMIMNYHQYPTSYNWSNMDPYDTDLSQLMYDIGDDVNMVYSCGISTAYPAAAYNEFKNTYGYSSTYNWQTFNFGNIHSEIQNSRPVLITGDDSLDPYAAAGHMWVTDGSRMTYSCNGDGTADIYKQLHMNWGWYGNYNGWYNYNNYYTVRSADTVNFNSSNYILRNIHP